MGTGRPDMTASTWALTVLFAYLRTAIRRLLNTKLHTYAAAATWGVSTLTICGGLPRLKTLLTKRSTAHGPLAKVTRALNSMKQRWQ